MLNHNSVGGCIEFLESVAWSNLLSEKEDLGLYKLVKNFQIHCHSKTCRKYKNKPCYFKFGYFLYRKDSNCNAFREFVTRLRSMKL